jgi:hypothetical protein
MSFSDQDTRYMQPSMESEPTMSLAEFTGSSKESLVDVFSASMFLASLVEHCLYFR